MAARGGKPPALGAVEKDIVARGTFAAILAASRENCDCKACGILRNVADAMMKEFG